MIEIQAYLCQFCAKGRKNKGTTFRTLRAVTVHEKRCFFNPTAQACATCQSLCRSRRDEDGNNYPTCRKGHDLERRATPHGDSEGGLRFGCEDWTPAEVKP